MFSDGIVEGLEAGGAAGRSSVSVAVAHGADVEPAAGDLSSVGKKNSRSNREFIWFSRGAAMAEWMRTEGELRSAPSLVIRV
ncbi:MAG TPA: hypothetical protein VGR72_09630 [Candidatus Acidoferrales bacterium]|nr:hypothetical protein [Candidatus Acidoferrales bacterium]